MAFMILTLLIFIQEGADIFYLINNNKAIEKAANIHDIVLAFNVAAFQSVRANTAIHGYMI